MRYIRRSTRLCLGSTTVKPRIARFAIDLWARALAIGVGPQQEISGKPLEGPVPGGVQYVRQTIQAVVHN